MADTVMGFVICWNRTYFICLGSDPGTYALSSYSKGGSQPELAARIYERIEVLTKTRDEIIASLDMAFRHPEEAIASS